MKTEKSPITKIHSTEHQISLKRGLKNIDPQYIIKTAKTVDEIVRKLEEAKSVAQDILFLEFR